MTDRLQKFWWLWVPVLWMVIQTILEATLDRHTLSLIHSENGPHELLQFFIIAGAFLVAVRTLFASQLQNQKWLKAWVALAAVCCFYVAGEEISWGQQFLHWTTPGFWDQINDQHETNLHNTSSWLDQKPRMLLEIGILIGGLIIPVLRRFRPASLPPRFSVIYPPDSLFIPALFVAIVKIGDTIHNISGIHVFERGSEVQELYMFYFVLLYMIVLRQRIQNK